MEKNSKRKEVQRMQRAMDAYLKSQEEQLTLEEKRKRVWFPVHVEAFIQGGEALKKGAEAMASDLAKIGFNDEEFQRFINGLLIYSHNVTKAWGTEEVQKLAKEGAENRKAEELAKEIEKQIELTPEAEGDKI